MYIKAIPDGETWQAALNTSCLTIWPFFIYNLHNQKYRTGQVSIQKLRIWVYTPKVQRKWKKYAGQFHFISNLSIKKLFKKVKETS